MLRITFLSFIFSLPLVSPLLAQQQVIFVQLNTKLLDSSDQFHPLDGRLEGVREYLTLSETDPLYQPDALDDGDVELIEDDCFVPSHKLIYRDFTYVLSLDCNSARKFVNASEFIPGQQEVENDFVFSRELAGLLLNRENELENLEPSPLEQTDNIDADEVLSEMADLADEDDDEISESSPDNDAQDQIQDLEDGIEEEVDNRDTYLELLKTYLAEEHLRTWEEDRDWLEKRLEESETLADERDELALEDEDLTKDIEETAPIPLVHSELGRVDNTEHEQEVIDYLHTFIDAMTPLDVPVILSQMDYVVEEATYLSEEDAHLEAVYASGYQKTQEMFEAEPELLEEIEEDQQSADEIEEDLDMEVIAIESTELQIEAEVEADEDAEMMQLIGMMDFELSSF
ncbi:MAG: hypothetical protein ACOCZ8_00405 [Bacteroidota bacterium]